VKPKIANLLQEVHIYLYQNSVQMAYINENTVKAALISLYKELIRYSEKELNQLSFTLSHKGRIYQVNIEDFQRLRQGEITAEELLKKK
jgi:hypothetical protein